MSGDCAGCDEAVQESASIIAALVRRLGGESVELTDDELAAFTPDTAVLLRRGESGVTIEVSAVDAQRNTEEASCES
ncbi:hypothetical protein BBK82_03180 [Lentzea guizhouensis]|uniref:Uncharacterized protein n=1 Tax=Lentzea guizhouensis TaxID=1586287 RepID=A0A1B2HBW9_9PSEU|nr:hypothetical protein [Lentzea guizhouensis]ANZ35220.1 hypothetical protein BBK82_03180 [Lentzea guizhouensis]